VAEIRDDPAAHPLRQQLLRAELLPYQLDGIAFAVGAGRAILADDMGLGKTIQGIGVAEMLAREAGIRKVLVVCPTSLKSQWRNEIHRFSARDCQLVLGGAAQRSRQYDSACFFTVCNYEQVLRDILPIERAKWDLIILDEGQRIKNWEAKTTRIVTGLRSRFALVLSGTPLENRLDELYSVISFIDDRRLGPAFRFFNRHRVVDEKGKVLGYKNLAELREKLKPILLRRTRGAVAKQLPPRTTEVVRIAPTAEQIDLHRAHMRIVSSIVKKAYISEMDLLRLQKALLMCRMAADGTFLVDKQEPGYSSKLEELDRLLEQIAREEDRKTVLFSEWTTMLGLVERLLDRHALGYVRLDGSVPQKKRQQLVHEFQTDPACKVFITTNAGATGLNLQAANTVINVDLPWNPAVLEQRIGRAHRMGQKRPVQVFVLVTEGTIEENLLATLSAKHDLARAALDVESDLDVVDMASGIEELKNRLEVLLGAKPEAPLDESERARQEETARAMVQQEKISVAGGQLLGAAFSFLGEMLPEQAETDESRQMTELLRGRLTECLQQDEQGQYQLKVTLPDASAIDNLASSLGRLLAPRISG
jgi:SNF2 family DNA or RNA helicase